MRAHGAIESTPLSDQAESPKRTLSLLQDLTSTARRDSSSY
nr:MAG TPA: hypothetical protein [Caudoviricetes sp.]